MAESMTHTVRVRWLFPPGESPVADATLEIVDGCLVDWSDTPCDLPVQEVAVIAGLVNAHTHLEFSPLEQPLPSGRDFTEWIRQVVGWRRTAFQREDPSDSQALHEQAVRRGYQESFHHGVTAVGEIATADDFRVDGGSEESRAEGFPLHRPAETVVFREVLGFSRSQLETQRKLAETHLQRSWPTGVQPGLSPHAPYSVHPELFRRIVERAKKDDLPVAFHLAETTAELEFLAAQTGPFRELLEAVGVWEESVLTPGTRPMDYLQQLALLPSALVIHGNYLQADELAFLARSPSLTLVYCPRTHAHFGHTPHPWQQVLADGGCVALGTDSRASNPDLSLWGEVVFLRQQFPQVDPQLLLELATVRGERALLRRDAQPFRGRSLQALSVIQLENGPQTDPWKSLFSPGTHAVHADVLLD